MRLTVLYIGLLCTLSQCIWGTRYNVELTDRREVLKALYGYARACRVKGQRTETETPQMIPGKALLEEKEQKCLNDACHFVFESVGPIWEIAHKQQLKNREAKNAVDTAQELASLAQHEPEGEWIKCSDSEEDDTENDSFGDAYASDSSERYFSFEEGDLDEDLNFGEDAPFICGDFNGSVEILGEGIPIFSIGSELIGVRLYAKSQYIDSTLYDAQYGEGAMAKALGPIFQKRAQQYGEQILSQLCDRLSELVSELQLSKPGNPPGVVDP